MRSYLSHGRNFHPDSDVQTLISSSFSLKIGVQHSNFNKKFGYAGPLYQGRREGDMPPENSHIEKF